jgi:hypothetical protein
MNKTVKVLLINVAVVIAFVFLMMALFGYYDSNDFLIGFGLTSLAVAGLDLFVSLILFLSGKHNYEVARGFLLSAGVLLLVGFTACGFVSISFH